MKIKGKFNIHNHFGLKVVDKGGDVIQEAEAENTLLDRYWNNIWSVNDNVSFLTIGIGTGAPDDGSTVDKTRTSMYNSLGFLSAEERTVESSLNDNERLTTITMTVTFPATETYEGDISEVATASSSNGSYVNSLALLTDSEGNPITIYKSSSDNLIVTATIYISVVFGDDILPTFTEDVISFALSRNDTNSSYSISGSIDDVVSLTNSYTTTDILDYSPRNSINTQHDKDGIVGVSHTGFNHQLDERYIETDTIRHPDTDGNLGFANFIQMSSLGAIPLPNNDYIPNYVIDEIEVGVGDGQSVTFPSPVPEFIDGSDVVKVDGTVLERDVDYTLTNEGNSSHAHSVAPSSKVPRFMYTGGSGSYDKGAVRNNPLNYGTSGSLSRTVNVEFEEPIRAEGVFIPESMSQFLLEYSNDGEEYTQLVNNGRSTYGEGWLSFEEPITAKYWKISCDRRGPEAAWLGKKPDDGIVFTNPPADGAKITLTCEVDRPFKTKDYVFDTSFRISY